MEPSRPSAGEADAPSRIKVLVVDDHGVVRRGLRGFFELLDDIEVVGEAEDGRRAVQLADDLAPDVVLDLASRTQAALRAIEHGAV